MKITKFLSLACILILGFFASCEEEYVLEKRLSSIDPRNIFEIISQTDNLSSLSVALSQTGLNSTLSENTTFTVFAPNNSAFSSVDLSGLTDEQVTNILLNHVIRTTTPDFSATMSTGYLNTLAVGPLDYNLSLFINVGSEIIVNGTSKLISGNIDKGATNGILHSVDAVVTLPDVVDHVLANPNYSSLAAALTRADLVNDLKSRQNLFTFFAPSNAAFEKFMMDVNAAFGWTTLNDIPLDVLREVLLYHVVSGENLIASDLSNTNLITMQSESFSINNGVINDASYTNSNVTITNIQGINGVVHGVDKVLLPDTVFQLILDKILNLPERASDKGYSMFLAAVEKAGLTVDITSKELTAFIPNNGAFTTFFLTIENFDGLDDFNTPQEISLLKRLLQYHLHPGTLVASQLTSGLSITTEIGEAIEYTGSSLNPTHENAPEAFIVNPNIGASNATIHEIDNVLVPDSEATALGYPLPASGAAVYGYEIYDDALNSAFWIGGWTSPDFANTEQVKSGIYSIKVNYQGDDGFQIGGANEDLTQYSTVNASLYSPNGTSVTFILNEQWGNGQTVNIPAGQWTNVSIPITNISNGTTSLTQFVIRDASLSANTLYIDEVGLDVTYQTPIPTFAYEVYTEDNLNAGWVGGWSSPVFNSSSNTSSGIYAIEVDLAASAGFQIGGTNIDLTQYSVVKFSVYCETSNTFKLVLNEKWDGYEINPTPGQWNHYTVPLSSVLYGTSTYTQFVIQELSGNNVKLFIDDIGFD